MPIDEELLRPTRELIAMMDAQIATAEHEMMQRIERLAHDEEEYKFQLSRAFHQKVEPLRRQRDATIKTLTDYYAAQPLPPQTISVGQG